MSSALSERAAGDFTRGVMSSVRVVVASPFHAMSVALMSGRAGQRRDRSIGRNLNVGVVLKRGGGCLRVDGLGNRIGGHKPLGGEAAASGFSDLERGGRGFDGGRLLQFEPARGLGDYGGRALCDLSLIHI